MNFDEDELELNTLWNQYVNLKRDEYWAEEENKLLKIRINEIKQELFFLYIDRYIRYLQVQETDEELELEYVKING